MTSNLESGGGLSKHRDKGRKVYGSHSLSTEGIIIGLFDPLGEINMKINAILDIGREGRTAGIFLSSRKTCSFGSGFIY